MSAHDLDRQAAAGIIVLVLLAAALLGVLAIGVLIGIAVS